MVITLAGLGQVLEFMYTAKLSLSPQNLEDVLAVANFLQMQEIVNACSAYQSMATPAVSLLTLDFAVGEFGLHIVFVISSENSPETILILFKHVCLQPCKFHK